MPDPRWPRSGRPPIPWPTPAAAPDAPDAPDTASAPPRPLAATEEAGSDRRFVLCVEDNDDNRRLISKLLGSRGIRVLEAVDGQSGLDALERLRPAVLLLDISLPDLGGLEVVATIRGHREAAIRGIPIIALTASAMPGDRERFLAQGCDDYLSKPLRALELIAMVESYLA